jgi:DNA uptake protein ComE-like DNA-binding protein
VILTLLGAHSDGPHTETGDTTQRRIGTTFANHHSFIALLKNEGTMKLLCAIGVCIIALTACNNQDTNKTREEAAKAAAEFKQATKEAGKEIKKGAEEARKQGTAIAQGVREGWHSDEKLVDLNSASRSQLMGLPGVDSKSAVRIIAGRPYHTKEELESKGIVSGEEYQKIQDRITTK